MKFEIKLNFLIISMIIITILIWALNLNSLKKVRESEKILKNKNEILEKKKKELDQKIIAYDKKFDLKKIRKNMEKNGMEIATEVIFFELGE